MIYINEWLPNPIGSDTCKINCGWNVEWVELYNSGGSAVSLYGWFLWTGGKAKKLSLNGFSIAAHGFVVLKRPQIKITLKNTDGGLWLYGSGGNLIDHAAFAGAATEGKSFSRVDYSTANMDHFAFVDPTPGAENNRINNQVAVQHYPIGVSLVPATGSGAVLGLMLGAAITIIGAWAYIIYTNETISNIFFPRDAGTR